MISCKVLFSAVLFFLLIPISCLSFGEDITTDQPTQQQIEYCRVLFSLRSDVNIEPRGLMIMGSGIDDAVWFKFETSPMDADALFDTTSICHGVPTEQVSFYTGDDFPQWWDTRNRVFPGWTGSVGHGAWLTIGFQEEPDRIIWYGFYNET